MAEAFGVDPERLAEAVGQMAEFQRFSQSLGDEIEALVKNLHLTWTGEAATAHAEAHRRWAHGEAVMREALSHLQSAGSTAHANYTGVMAKNLGMWS